MRGKVVTGLSATLELRHSSPSELDRGDGALRSSGMRTGFRACPLIVLTVTLHVIGLRFINASILKAP
jgi:hypothetical protein